MNEPFDFPAISEQGELACDQIARKAIAQMMLNTVDLDPSEDGLATTWEVFCAGLQSAEPSYAKFLLDYAFDVVFNLLDDVKPLHLEAARIFLCRMNPSPHLSSEDLYFITGDLEVAEYIAEHLVQTRAKSYTNERMAHFLASPRV